MVKVLNMFREFSMKNVAGYNKLSEEEKSMFDTFYEKHLSSMHIEERKHYTDDKIKLIEAKKSILKVYFENGEYFIYFSDENIIGNTKVNKLTP